MQSGFIDILASDFALGWAADMELGTMPPVLVARLGEEVLGWSVTRFARGDLPSGAAFVIAYSRALTPDEVPHVEVVHLRGLTPLRRGSRARIETGAPLKVFVVGSPRSGTSQLGKCLSQAFGLPWMGEGHGAPILAGPWNAIPGKLPNARFAGVMEHLDMGAQIISLAREGYYFAHASGSFLDKTPGVEMVRSVPMLHAAFPDARFIFAKRHGVANVLSRMAKFGGMFEAHCNDWTASMQAWLEVRDAVPHALEVDQMEMLNQPEETADRICRYLGRPDEADVLVAALASNSMERTGAGIGRARLSETGWTADQATTFIKRCGGMMEAFGYPVVL